MRVSVFLLFMLGVCMGSEIKYVKMKGVEIPVISETSGVVPIGLIKLNFLGGGSFFDSAYSSTEQLPVAYISSGVLNYGTKSMGNVGFAKLLDSKAVSIGFYSGNLYLSLNSSFLKEQQDFAIERIRDLITDPNITNDTLDNVATRTLSELVSKETDFDYQASVLLKSALFENTPFSYPAIGTQRGIASMKLDHVKKYIKNNMVLSRLTILIGGDLDVDFVIKKLEKVLQHLEVGTPASYGRVVANDRKKELVTYKDTKQAFVYFGAPLNVVDIEKDGYKARVAAFILGSSGFGSRFMEEIRVKRGLAYSAYMGFNVSKFTSYASGYMQTSVENGKEAVELAKGIVKNFVDKGVTQNELDSAKSFILGSEPLRNETFSQRLNSSSDNFINDLPLNYSKEELNKIASLDLNTINAFIAEHPEIMELTFVTITNEDVKSKK